MVSDGQATLQGLSLIPHLTSVAAALYRSDVINAPRPRPAELVRAMMQSIG